MQINVDLKTFAVVVGLFITLGTTVGSYFVLQSDVDNLKTDVSKQAEQVDELRMKSAADGEALKNIQLDLSDIKKKLDELIKEKNK